MRKKVGMHVIHSSVMRDRDVAIELGEDVARRARMQVVDGG